MRQFVCVRWMAAYNSEGRYTDLESALRWELTQQEWEVAFAIQRPRVKLADSFLGLLVDLEKSQVRARFCGDAWTFNEGGVLKHTCSFPVRIRDPHVPPRVTKWHNQEQPYDEAVGRLVFKGVVVHYSANKAQRKLAAALAKKVGLPYLGTLREGMK